MVGAQGGKAPWKLLGFEHLNRVSVNDFEAFFDVFKCIKTCILWYQLVREGPLFMGEKKSSQKICRVNGHL